MQTKTRLLNRNHGGRRARAWPVGPLWSCLRVGAAVALASPAFAAPAWVITPTVDPSPQKVAVLQRAQRRGRADQHRRLGCRQLPGPQRRRRSGHAGRALEWQRVVPGAHAQRRAVRREAERRLGGRGERRLGCRLDQQDRRSPTPTRWRRTGTARAGPSSRRRPPPAARSRSSSESRTWAAETPGRSAAARPTARWSSTGTARPGRSSRPPTRWHRPAARSPAAR